jgi:hypothetical protein
MRTIVFLALSIAGAIAAAQDAGDATRGSTPPGASQDGSRPAEGAIRGGTLAPGETGGMPAKTPAGRARCYQLGGSLREQCLADEARKTGAETRPPSGATPARRD